MPNLSAYFLCTSPRTGSTLLADTIARTGCAGRPNDFFEFGSEFFPDGTDIWYDKYKHLDEADFFNKILEWSATANHIAGMKVHWHQMAELCAKLTSAFGGTSLDDESTLPLLSDLFKFRLARPRYIWLSRKNKIAQAISLYIAIRTQTWRKVSDVPSSSEPESRLRFDYSEIDRLVSLCESFDRNWSEYFRVHRIQPLTIDYDKLITSLDFTTRCVMQFVGISNYLGEIRCSGLIKQASERSLRWEEQYKALKEAERKSP